ncbi:hypothetical protein [Bordetella genomosp. 4]|uniref:Uncharacterized protein n=1 Tax=Bordetella genomosp. 4 TaxID=463044 RepID=A0A261U640_9BORD|nr:hypothetical protein [Bordetella genomosp. 4]OZI56323.1 hypothetical protein CAL20_12850 [Bordetella genomosp. 4]
MIDIVVKTLMWGTSSVLLLAYFFGVTLRKPFKTVAVHFLMVLAVHVVLSAAAILLTKHGQGIKSLGLRGSPGVAAALLLGIKLYMAVLMIFLLNFFAALAQRGVSAMAKFHTTHNAANLDRQPVRGFLRHQQPIVRGYQALFMTGGVFMLWALWFRFR